MLFHVWRYMYHVFVRKLTWYVIGVYVIHVNTCIIADLWQIIDRDENDTYNWYKIVVFPALSKPTIITLCSVNKNNWA